MLYQTDGRAKVSSADYTQDGWLWVLKFWGYTMPPERTKSIAGLVIHYEADRQIDGG